MKSLVFAAAALALAALTTPALAANGDGADDGPFATYNWGGFYGGINGGYSWNEQGFGAPGNVSYNTNGMLAGGTVGFNIDSGDWIFGAEGDYGWADMRGSATCAVATNCASKLDRLGTARARVGYDVAKLIGTNPLLVYGTAGLAFGNSEFSISGPTGKVDDSKTTVGGVYGAGLEYVVANNWSVKAEYLRTAMGNDTYDLGGTSVRGNTGASNIVRTGINYKF